MLTRRSPPTRVAIGARECTDRVERSRRRWLRAVAPLLALGLLGGCSTEKVYLVEGPREYVPSDYERVLRRWTRSDELVKLDELDNVLTVTATYESWDFRWAYVVRYTEDYRLTVEQRRALLERSLAESQREHQFFLALYAQRHKWSDLTKENPAWIVRLIDDVGSETVPLEITAIKDPGAIELTYFPYTTPWRLVYRLRFPVTRNDGQPTISRNARWFGLRFTGPQGHEELVWEIGGERTRSEPVAVTER
jgi:hypothetical protein